MCGAEVSVVESHHPVTAPPVEMPDAVPMGAPAPGHTRLEMLDLDVEIPGPHQVMRLYGRISIRTCYGWDIGFTIDSENTTLDGAKTQLPGGGRNLAFHASESTESGWRIVCSSDSGQSNEEIHVVIRRRVANMTVDVWARGPITSDVSLVDAVSASLTAVPGGVATWQMPAGRPIIRVMWNRGCYGPGGADVALWLDGTIQRWRVQSRTERGELARIDPSQVAALLATIKASGCYPPMSDVQAAAQPKPPPMYVAPTGDAPPPRPTGRMGGLVTLRVFDGDAWRTCSGPNVDALLEEVERVTKRG